MPHAMSQEEKFKQLTQAPIPRLIGRLALPSIISMLITSFYNITDTFFVGKIGTSATAAIGVVFPVMTIIQALGLFCGHGSGNSISRRLGSKQSKAAEELAATGFYLALLIGSVLMILGLIFVKPLSLILGSTKTILPYTSEYLGIILIGAPYMTAQIVLNSQIRFQGNSLYSMVGLTIGGVLNIILDPIFIFVLDMGVSGAAIATILSQFVSFILLLAGVRISGCVPIRFRNIRFTKVRLMEILGGGLPSLCQLGLGSVATMTLNIAANPYGDASIAAMSVVGRIAMFASSSLIGFGQGFQPVCGFNYGAKKYERVREAFWFCVKISTFVLLLLSLLGAFVSGHLIGIFRNDPDVIRIGTATLRIQCLTFTLNGWVILNNMMMQTMGKTLYASLLASARQGLFFIPALLLLPVFFGFLGIQMAQAVADVCSFISATVLHRLVMKTVRAEELEYKERLLQEAGGK